jgi:vacuolar-type H+-ATPase subunit I/STV1
MLLQVENYLVSIDNLRLEITGDVSKLEKIASHQEFRRNVDATIIKVKELSKEQSKQISNLNKNIKDIREAVRGME